MTEYDPKADLVRYLKQAREALLWKLDGVDEYGVRRPLTPTGTNLLGLVKHVAGVTAGYFGDVFDRPFPDFAWLADDSPDNSDMWATATESRQEIVDIYARVWVHADATIASLSLDDRGTVPWWPDGRVTLHRVIVHMIAELNRHAGHADIVRELVDGQTGHRADNSNLPDQDQQWWRTYRAELEQVARRSVARA